MAVSWQITAAGQPAWAAQSSSVISLYGTAGSGGTLSTTFASSVYQKGFAAGTTTLLRSSTGSYYNSSSNGTASGNGNTVSRSGATNIGGGIGTTTESSSAVFASSSTDVEGTITATYSSSGSVSLSREATRSIVGNNWSQTERYTYGNTIGSNTASGIASGPYTSATSSSTTEDYRAQSTTQTATRSIITKHSDSSLSSTTTESQTYTETIQTYETVNTTTISYVTSSYITGINHLQEVWEAEYSEFLRPVTASPTALTGLDALLGSATRSLTLSTASGSYSYGVAKGQAFSTFTHSVMAVSAVTTTLTTTFQSFVPVTLGASDGWLGGTNTTSSSVGGIYTSTQAITDNLTTSASSYTTQGRATYTTFSQVDLTYILTDTVTGINSAGSSASYVIQRLCTTKSKYTATLVANDGPSSIASGYGFSVTDFTSPFIPYFIAPASVELSRLEKALGYQHASSLGSGGGRGVSLSANSSFFIGTENFIMCDPNGVRVPAPSVSTASTADSSYSFTQGAAGQWFVTALRTDISSSTLTTFTASVGTNGATNLFMNQYASWYASAGGSVIGGPNALSGIDQIATFHNLAGWKYTLKDSSSSTASTTHVVGYTTANIGTSLFAGESFSAISGDYFENAHLPLSFLILPFNQ